MEHLIADSGLQFITKEIEFNPSEPLFLSNGKTLKYSFCETKDFIEGIRTFNLLCYSDIEDKFIPVDELQDGNNIIERRPNGREELDEAGMYIINPEGNTTLFTTYSEDDEDVYSINSLQSFRVKDPLSGHGQICAFDLLLDKWLPMPMFRKEVDGITSNYPLAWCRMKIQRIGTGSKKGYERYRTVWVFDTQMSEDELSVLRPYIGEEDDDHVEYGMCNKADLLLDFMSSREDFHAFSDYIASLLGIDTTKEESRKYKAFYIYFLNFIRLLGVAPDITLYNNLKRKIPVDLVIDVGNSRTCGILFEEGEFSKGKMLELRNLTRPWIVYENKTFDMRVVFRKADFGNDIVLDEDMFNWKSFLRIGEEARELVYRSLEEEGLSEKTTNYSSPKRYLWDTKRYEGQWENLVTTDDPFNVLLSNEIYIPTLSGLFDEIGNFTPEKEDDLFLDGEEHHYSRASLMTFAFVEIFQQAISQMNSIRYRGKWGNVDCRRHLRNVIITCPTAMPLKEQTFLRQSAQNAYQALTKCITNLEMAEITPSAAAVKITDQYANPNARTWSYDEASCCQLVYLYAEIAQRYDGEIHKFFELKGHKSNNSDENKTLTIGSIDIGAGTTDIMVCSYEYEGNGCSKITPTPLFWDSFYLAGDDILRNLVQNIVIEGKNYEQKDLGNISNALTARIISMSDEELQSLPCLDNVVYKTKINDICSTLNEEERKYKKIAFASNLIHDFFGKDSSMMGYRDRRCRNDFNVQISVPIAQRMMELLRTHRPSKTYTYNEMFEEMKPADYLLNYFEHHFGFRFEELSWRYEPMEVVEIVKSTMEPLMKQLALVLYSQKCDIIVLAGRPTSLDAITELFVKYIPTPPHRLIRLNEYRVGSWFPTADGQGYFYDQKSMVAVGGMVGYLASHSKLKGLVIDFTKMIQRMTSTANYIGLYNSRRQQVSEAILSPSVSSTSFSISVFPAYLGCRQLNSSQYQARPLYAIYSHGKGDTLQIRISRSYHDDKEKLIIDEVTDSESRNRKKDIELVEQSLVDNGKYWLDNGEFELTIK